MDYPAAKRNVQSVFIDEYGTPSLEVEKSDVSTHFIVAAVIVSDAELPHARAQAEALRLREFQKGEIRSKRVGKDQERRIRILKAITKLPVHLYATVVDKREIVPAGGLIYRTSFVKYVHRLLFSKLFRVFEEVHISADEYGRREFMDGFKKYVQAHAKFDLFCRDDFNFVSSESDVLIQVADFVAGSLGHFYDAKKTCNENRAFLEVLRPRLLCVDEWPPDSRFLDFNENEAISDERVANHCMRQASLFLEKHHDSDDEDEKAQVEFLRYLIFSARVGDPGRYIHASRLLEVLSRTIARPINIRYLRSKVVARLRDEDVIIASTSRGYKIPLSAKDVQDFVSSFSVTFGPMLERIRRARFEILLATKNEVDILDGAVRTWLKRLLMD